MYRRHQELWPPLIGAAVLIVGSAVASQLLPGHEIADTVSALARNGGTVGGVIFVGLFVIAVLIPPVPRTPLVLISGALFGFWAGLLLSLLGATIGSLLNYILARRFSTYARRRLGRYERYVRHVQVLGTWPAIIVVRAFGGFAFDYYSYLLGILRIRWFTFVWATAAGIAPGLAIDVYAGGYLLSAPWMAAAFLLAAAGLSVGSYYALRRMGWTARWWRVSEAPGSKSAVRPLD